MKNLKKILGIIAIAAVIGFSMTACPDDPGNSTQGTPPDTPAGDPVLSGNISITVGGTAVKTATVGTTLTASYSGTETVSYQWKRGTTNLGTAQTQAATEAGSYTVTVSAAGYQSKTSAAVTVTSGGGGDDRVELTAYEPTKTVAYNYTGVTATFLGAVAGLTFTEADFTLTGTDGGIITYVITYTGASVVVGVDMAMNNTETPRTFIVGINPDSTVFRGSATVTIIQEAYPYPELPGNISIRVNGTQVTYADVGATLTANYSGSESVTYQWKRGTTDLGTNQTQAATTTGRYTVTVSAAGYLSKSAAVQVGITSAEDLAFVLENATGGATASNPIVVRVDVADLGGAYNTEGSIGNVIYQYSVGGGNRKYISLDLSGSTLANIVNSAFYNCVNLVSVTIPDSVNSIGNYAFAYSGLISITIGNNVNSIGSNAFDYCTNLRNITINTDKVSNGLNSNWGHRFPADNLNVTFNVNPGDYAFANCARLASVTIGNSVTSIGYGAFNSTSLASIIIPANVTIIEEGAFNACYNLASVKFERDGDTTIDSEYAFKGNLVTVSGGTGAQNRLGTYTTIDPSASRPQWVKQ